MKIGQNLSE